MRSMLRSLSRRFSREFCSPAGTEEAIKQKILRQLRGDATVDVRDASGGCGTFYRIEVSAEEFRGRTTIEQHRKINSILKVSGTVF